MQQNATGVYISDFAKAIDLAALKPIVHKLDIDKLEKVQCDLSSSKSKVHELDTGKNKL